MHYFGFIYASLVLPQQAHNLHFSLLSGHLITLNNVPILGCLLVLPHRQTKRKINLGVGELDLLGEILSHSCPEKMQIPYVKNHGKVISILSC